MARRHRPDRPSSQLLSRTFPRPCTRNPLLDRLEPQLGAQRFHGSVSSKLLFLPESDREDFLLLLPYVYQMLIARRQVLCPGVHPFSAQHVAFEESETAISSEGETLKTLLPPMNES